MITLPKHTSYYILTGSEKLYDTNTYMISVHHNLFDTIVLKYLEPCKKINEYNSQFAAKY